MKRFLGSTAALALVLGCVLAPAAQAQAPTKVTKETKTTTTTTTTTTAKPKVGGVRGSLLFQIGQAEEKLLALANAVPAEKYTWKPADGVRTVGEVFNHVASANYFFPTFWNGGKVPPGIDPRTFEKEMGGDKAKTIDILTKSFDYVRQEIVAAPEGDLNRNIKIFGQDATVRDAMLVVVTHAHEHLGQSIAYARSIGVVPPWSAAGQ
jgi:uncharacterized damage-inducible protein DinB